MLIAALNIWQKDIDLVMLVYRVTGQFPETERYGLSAQMRRASVSVPSNVAEGFRRGRSKEFKQFLNISLGSLAELETQIVIAEGLRYLDERAEADLLEHIDHTSRMISSLIKRL